MERFFEFSTTQRKTLTILGMAFLVIGGYKMIRTYVPSFSHHRYLSETGAIDPYRPLLVLDVNYSPIDSLELVPGIGPSLARRIVDYRQAHGRFVSVDSLINVRGIGPVTLEKMRPYFKDVSP